ncbi:MAG: restriction endonuclease subunit S [Clostridia bacterium]|nr:restriction endonuclease subunit S [Clostridia bacterium]
MRALKYSGVEWIGDIPSDWNIIKIGNQYTERKTKVSDKDYPPLSVTMKGVVPQLANAAKTDAHDDRKLVCVGDFAINSRSDRRGSCGISEYDGSVSLINTILAPRDKMNPKYYNWLFHSTMFSDEFYKWGHGIVNDLWTTNWQDMKHIAIPEPPLSEQERIADFLDRKCAEIDTVIEKTKATIEEYKKLKQSVITEAVTKGIRGDRAMKDSGIDWIGDIPAEWEIRKLFRAIDKIGDIDHYMPNSVETGIPYLMTGDLKEKISQVDFDVCKQVSLEDYETLSSKIKATKGDIIFARYATIGTVCIVDIDKDFLVSYSCLTIKPTQSLLIGNFLFYYLKSTAFFEDVKQYINSNTQANVGLDSMTKAKIVLPTLQEQEEIADFLDRKCAEIDKLIADKTHLLDEMESYKKSVIYEYVTGKKEVE